MLRDRIFQIFRIWALKVGDPYDKKIVESNRYRTGISKKYFELTQIYKIYECKLWILFLKITKDNWCCWGHHDTNSPNILQRFLSLNTHNLIFNLCLITFFIHIHFFICEDKRYEWKAKKCHRKNHHFEYPKNERDVAKPDSYIEKLNEIEIIFKNVNISKDESLDDDSFKKRQGIKRG